jgi:glycosyltransferase involved in cell wall biosynthesis
LTTDKGLTTNKGLSQRMISTRRIGTPDGPAVQVASASSVFPAILDADWTRRGLKTALVTCDQIPSNYVYKELHRLSQSPSFFFSKITLPLNLLQSWALHRNQAKFTRITGLDQRNEWEGTVIEQNQFAWRLARQVMELRPRFVFGQEIFAHGLPVALCRGIPRILFPWGSDIMNSPETWFGADWLVRYSLRSADLILPSSTTAADHIVKRFSLDPSKVIPISWGVDIPSDLALSQVSKEETKRRWGVPAGKVIVQNCRRLRRLWGCMEATHLFVKAAQAFPNAFFIMCGGNLPDIAADLSTIKQLVGSAGVENQFLFMERDVTLDEYIELANITDVGVSLMKRGDMRSASILQLAASGAALVLSDSAEARCMAREGLCAELVDPENPEQCYQSLARLLEVDEYRRKSGAINRTHAMRHEDRRQQFDLMMEHINLVCDKFYGQKT